MSRSDDWYRQNFERLCRAIRAGDMALLQCRSFESGEMMYTICATMRLPDG